MNKKSKIILISVVIIIILIISGYLFYENYQTDCLKEGKLATYCGNEDIDTECCPGYKSLTPKDFFNDSCNITTFGICGTGICTKKCGNGICDRIESKCNCPEDCRD